MAGSQHVFPSLPALLEKVKQLAVTPARHLLKDATFWDTAATKLPSQPLYEGVAAHDVTTDSDEFYDSILTSDN